MCMRPTIILFVAVLLTSCSKWPDDANQHRLYFQNNAESLKAIATMMDDENFNNVQLRNNGRDLHWERTVGESYESGVIENASGWARHLGVVKFQSAIRGEQGNVHFGLPSSVFRDDVIGTTEIVRESAHSNPLIGCKPEHRVVDCGACGWRLDGDWSLVYFWWPVTLIPEEDELYLAGELSLEKYMSLEETARRQCAIEGHSKIGYDVSTY